MWFYFIAGALVLPEKNIEENEVDFLKELPGEREYYRTSTEVNDFVPTTYSGDGSDTDTSHGNSEQTETGSGDAGLVPPMSSINPDLFSFYFVRVNLDGEENNETERQWLDFLQNNGVDLSKIHGSGGNFGVSNLMPRDDLIENNPLITQLEDNIQVDNINVSVANETGSPIVIETNDEEMKSMRILNSESSDVPMDIPDDQSIDQFNSTMYEFVNETNLYRPSDESVERNPDVVSGEVSMEDNISLVSQGDQKSSHTDSLSDGETIISIPATSRPIVRGLVENQKSIGAIIKRYKVLRGWSFGV